ncbi:MAG: hypothetical protein K0S12_1609 [Bacteroidetes bacterium]|jgi:hypothetical protein|nr:hypothetical protein [Bacteroidota bacterium]
MKHLLILLFILTIGLLKAQKPEKIYPNAREHKSIAYLKEQSLAWKKVAEQEPANANAWFNYYYANRNLMFNDTTDKRSNAEKDLAIKKIIDDMEKNIPETYEFNFCKWLSGGWNMSLLPYLKKAQELGPERPEHIDYSIVLAEMEGKTDQRDFYSKKKQEAGQISTGMMYYSYNMLIGLAPNAILVTGGDNDTYPVWLLQARGIRKDVKLVHLHLLQLEDYQNAVFKELGIEKWPVYKGKNHDSAKAAKQKYRNGIIEHLTKNKNKLPVYLALTASHDYADAVSEHLYLTGLTYQYSKEPIDNIAVMKRNFEQYYAMDYIENAFYEDISPALVNAINGNYVIPMLKLYDHYRTAGEKHKEEWIKQKLIAVSKGNPDEEKIKKHLNLN